MQSVFISYRRQDTQQAAGRLADHLGRRFGKGAVVIDVDTDQVGHDYREVISGHLDDCEVALVMIGDAFLEPDSSGTRRIDAPNDPVRLELSRALERDLPVIPVLVDGAEMPTAAELPDPIRALAFRGAVELAHARFDRDADFIADQVARLFRDQKQAGRTSGSRSGPSTWTGNQRALAGAALAVVLIVIAAVVIALVTSESDSTATEATTTTSTTVVPTTTRSTDVDESTDTLEAQGELVAGDTLSAADGRHVLRVDPDGYLLLETDGGTRWRSQNTGTSSEAVAVMQGDGNLVVYRSQATKFQSPHSLWDSGTEAADNSARLRVVDEDGEGYAVIETDADGEIWRRPVTESPPATDPTTSTTSTTTSSTTSSTTTTTTIPTVTDGAIVRVVNATSVGGVAGALTGELDELGFETGDPSNASASFSDLDESVVFYERSNRLAFEVAESVARALGIESDVEQMPVPPPTDSGQLDGADVVVVLGDDWETLLADR